MSGVEVLRNTKAYMTWAAIAFKFNEGKIDHMKNMAAEQGFDAFQLTLSTKFNKNYSSYPMDDPLQPSDQFIADGRFTRTTNKLSNKTWKDECLDVFTNRFYDTNTNASIIPLCMIGNKGLYLNAQGRFYPCCWTALRYGHNKEVFDYIKPKQTLGEILDDPLWSRLFNNLSSVKECREKCSAQKWSLDHATSW
jgi:MoaA/NifB/PqqE/SkfB family radical SAM enzyme